jgi:hypothetical protein
MLQPFFEWMQGIGMSSYILSHTWPAPIVNILHLLSLVVFSGAVLVLDIRLIGRGLKETSVADVSRMAQPWLIWGFVALLVTGIPQMTSTAMKQYYSPFFWFKMELLLIGLIFTFTIRRWVAMADEARIGVVLPKVVGITSMAMWTGVAIWARLIGLG